MVASVNLKIDCSELTSAGKAKLVDLLMNGEGYQAHRTTAKKLAAGTFSWLIAYTSIGIHVGDKKPIGPDYRTITANQVAFLNEGG